MQRLPYKHINKCRPRKTNREKEREILIEYQQTNDGSIKSGAKKKTILGVIDTSCSFGCWFCTNVWSRHYQYGQCSVVRRSVVQNGRTGCRCNKSSISRIPWIDDRLRMSLSFCLDVCVSVCVCSTVEMSVYTRAISRCFQ